ncbi:MAG: type II toxin-antitoxin system VapC family toxin [Nitrospiraceae bacterium]|nr:MAG: type II toxin-antitoxin system VapC family toxin [Nitrospiraceae bacterium]
MKALIDTHVFLWWLADDPQLPQNIRDIIADGNNELYFSAASCWEIAIKAQLGKIILPDKADVFISAQLSLNGIRSLPIQSSHALHVFKLPALHRDPFDRMLVSQAQLENMPIITSDSLIALYQVEYIWNK